MFRTTLMAGLAAASLAAGFVPAVAQAQTQCQAQRHDNRVVGTILGAGLGALLGNAIGEPGGKPGGPIIGGVGGALAGDAIGASSVDCGARAYGYDDPRRIPGARVQGYYGPDGRWSDPGANDGRYAYGPPPAYGPQAGWDPRARADRLERRIQERMADGALDEWRGRHALRELRDIRRIDADYRGDDGWLNEDQRRDVLARLDRVAEDVGEQRVSYREPRRY